MAKLNSIEQFKKLKDELSSTKVKPIYFVCGDEVFFHDRLIENVIALIPEDSRDFNTDIFYGQDTTIDSILNASRSYPMMAEKRLVLVRDFFKSSNGITDELNRLITYFEKPSPTTLLVLIDKKTPNKVTKFGKAVTKSNSVSYFEFNTIPEFQLPDWITRWAIDHYEQPFDAEAAELLAQYVGDDLLQLSNEIEKLSTFKDGSKLVTKDDVKKIVGFSREYSIFELKDAIISKNKNKALHIAERILYQSDSVVGEIIKSIGFFASMYSTIWKYLTLKQKKYSDSDIKKELKIFNDFRFKNVSMEARSYSLNQIPMILEILLDADKAIKGFSKLEPESIYLFTIKKIVSLK